MNFYFIFVFSCFLFFSFFFQHFIFLSYFSPSLFSFFYAFFNLFFLDTIKIINVYRFLLIDICLVTYVFLVFKVFAQRTLRLFLVFVRFGNDVEITLQVKTSFFRGALNLWENVGINILKNAFVARQVIS